MIFIPLSTIIPSERQVLHMAKFIPKAKMSKKARKELAKQNRVTWEMNPVTRKTENKKAYNRKKNSRERFDEPPGVFFLRYAVRL